MNQKWNVAFTFMWRSVWKAASFKANLPPNAT
jgi:hypothetical protein